METTTATKRAIDSSENQKQSSTTPKLEQQLISLVKTDVKLTLFLIEEISEEITQRDIECTLKNNTF